MAAAREPVDVPAWYARQLRLAEIAGLQGAGRTDEARTLVGGLSPGLDAEAWRRVSHPLVWGLLEDAAAGRPTARLRAPVPTAVPVVDAPPVDQPFAPPSAPSVPARAVARAAGAIPVEGLVLAAARRPGHALTLRILALVLVALAPVLLALVSLLTALDGPEGVVVRLGGVVGPFALALGSLVLVDVSLARHRLRDAPTVVLSDGRQVARRWFTAWWATSIVRLLAGAALVFGVFAAAEGLSVGTPWTVLLGVPFALLMVYAAYRRQASARLVAAVHFLPPDEARRVAERSPAASGSGRGWLALARLWTGDAEGAGQAAREGAVAHPELGWIEHWLQAGRGEVDLERVLAEADPERLGDRYRRAVLVAVAALRAGAAARVADRVDDWVDVAERLPNRYGALLARLVAGVRRANGQPVGSAAGEDVAWVARVWPFVP